LKADGTPRDGARETCNGTSTAGEADGADCGRHDVRFDEVKRKRGIKLGKLGSEVRTR